MTDKEDPIKICPVCSNTTVIGATKWGSRPMTTDRVSPSCTNPQCPLNPTRKCSMYEPDPTARQIKFTQSGARWPRIVLKLSGEAFGGSAQSGIKGDVVMMLAREILTLVAIGIDVIVVIGGGNIWRGKFAEGQGLSDRPQADYMGMLATVINGLALQDTLEQLNQPTRVMTALEINNVAEPYIRRRALRHLEKGRIVILAGGLGSPFFTTDTPAALRAAELSAAAVVKGTHGGVDGVYTADPKLDPTATKLDEVNYMDVLTRNLNVMDPTSITFCRDHHLPIAVYDALTPGNLQRILLGTRGLGSLVHADAPDLS